MLNSFVLYRNCKSATPGLLNVSIDALNNLCEPVNRWSQTILRMHPNVYDMNVFASGIRNMVGFTWDPRMVELSFADNGTDTFGDDRPEDELNHASRSLDFLAMTNGAQLVCDDHHASVINGQTSS